MEYMISVTISLLATVISSMAVFFLKHYFKKKEVKDHAREELTVQETILILRSINAVGKLALANCIALRDGKTNGETAAAMKEYETVRRELYDFLLQASSHNCAE